MIVYNGSRIKVWEHNLKDGKRYDGRIDGGVTWGFFKSKAEAISFCKSELARMNRQARQNQEKTKKLMTHKTRF